MNQLSIRLVSAPDLSGHHWPIKAPVRWGAVSKYRFLLAARGRSLSLVMDGTTGEPDLSDAYTQASGGHGTAVASFAVSVKLPAFDPEDPEIWFIQAENQFRLKKITKSDTMAEHVIQVLPVAMLRKMRTWLRDNPEEKDYYEMKAYLLEEFSLTPAERTRRIISLAARPLGDRKVSDLFNELESLFCLPSADPSESKRLDIEREMLLINLPDSVRTCLQDSSHLPLRMLVTKADRLLEAHRATHFSPTSNPINSVAISEVSEDSDTDINFLSKANYQERQFRGKKTRELVRGLCPYHFKYGQDSKRCWPECKLWKKFSSKNDHGNRR